MKTRSAKRMNCIGCWNKSLYGNIDEYLNISLCRDFYDETVYNGHSIKRGQLLHDCIYLLAEKKCDFICDECSNNDGEIHVNVESNVSKHFSDDDVELFVDEVNDLSNYVNDELFNDGDQEWRCNNPKIINTDYEQYKSTN